MQKLSPIITEVNSSPLVSIIMPTYNQAEFIVETINSIQKQTYHNWELIIVDDGSTDQTSEIVMGISDEKIHYHKEPHFGMEYARNFGLEKVKGEFICFMDSDDLWTDTKLEKQLDSFYQHPDACYCLTNGYDFKDLQKPISYFYKKRKGISSGDLFTSFFKSELAATIPALMVKKQVMQTVRFDKSRLLPDVVFILNLARHFKGIILYESLFFRRVHESSDSTIHHFIRHKQGIQLIKDYKEQLPRHIFSNALFRSHINFGEECIMHSHRFKAIQHFLKAWKYRPVSVIPVKKIVKSFLRSLKKDPSPVL